MKDMNIAVGVVSAFMMVISSAVCAADEMSPSEYYKTEILPKESGVYEYQEKIFIHSSSPYESKKPSAKGKAKLMATVGTGKLLRTWAIELTAPERATKETLSENEKYIKSFLDRVDGYWQFPDWQIAAKLQCVMDKQLANAYVVGMCGNKDMLVSSIPEAYKEPCTRERLRNALPSVAQRKMKGADATGFMKACGAWDLVPSAGGAIETASEFKGINDALRQYVQNSPLAKELREEMDVLNVPQVMTNKTSVMNDQGTMLTEKIEITKVTRFPRMQKLFLDYETETNYPTARLVTGTEAIASIRDAKVSVEGRIKLFRRALCDSPGDKELWNFLGRMLMARNDNLGAIICFRNALKLDGRFIYPIVNLTCAYKALGKENVAMGLAVVGRGLATDAWSIQELDKVLWNGTANTVTAIVPTSTSQEKPKATQSKVVAPVKFTQKQPAPRTSGAVQEAPKATPKPAPIPKPSSGFSSSEVNSEIDF